MWRQRAPSSNRRFSWIHVSLLLDWHLDRFSRFARLTGSVDLVTIFSYSFGYS